MIPQIVAGGILRRLFKWIFRHYVASFFLFFAIGLLIYGVQGIKDSSKFLKKAEHVPATILDSIYDYTKKRDVVTAEATFKNGEKKQFTILVDGASANFSAGDTQEVYYMPEAPDDIRFAQGAYRSHIIKLVLGIIFGVVGIILVIQDNKKRAAQEPPKPSV